MVTKLPYTTTCQILLHGVYSAEDVMKIFNALQWKMHLDVLKYLKTLGIQN